MDVLYELDTRHQDGTHSFDLKLLTKRISQKSLLFLVCSTAQTLNWGDVVYIQKITFVGSLQM